MTSTRHALPEATFCPDKFPTIVGKDPGLHLVLTRAARVAPTRIPVLISGESGTGKELLAELLHRRGPNPAGPFVAVNCGALPRELAESELFGHERGAFTGASHRKTGWFEEANEGTLVLDEIGELPLDLQPKLLRVLETGRLRRVGGSGEVSVRVRVAAMTLRDLRHAVSRGTFRNDLYHRLAGFELVLPPLRHRRGDIPLLAETFLAEAAKELAGDFDGEQGKSGTDRTAGARPCVLDEAAMRALIQYDWPGNIRELRNVLRRAAILSQHQIGPLALELPGRNQGDRRAATGLAMATEPSSWGQGHPQLADGDGPCPSDHRAARSWSVTAPPTGQPDDDQLPVGQSPLGELPLGQLRLGQLPLGGHTFDQIERAVFGWALRQNGGSRRQAARALGLPRSSFSDKVKRYGLV